MFWVWITKITYLLYTYENLFFCCCCSIYLRVSFSQTSVFILCLLLFLVENSTFVVVDNQRYVLTYIYIYSMYIDITPMILFLYYTWPLCFCSPDMYSNSFSLTYLISLSLCENKQHPCVFFLLIYFCKTKYACLMMNNKKNSLSIIYLFLNSAVLDHLKLICYSYLLRKRPALLLLFTPSHIICPNFRKTNNKTAKKKKHFCVFEQITINHVIVSTKTHTHSLSSTIVIRKHSGVTTACLLSVCQSSCLHTYISSQQFCVFSLLGLFYSILFYHTYRGKK